MIPPGSHRFAVGSKPSTSDSTAIVTLPPGFGVPVETPAPLVDVAPPLLDPPPQAASRPGAPPRTASPAAVLAPRARKGRRWRGSGLGTAPPSLIRDRRGCHGP